MPLGIFQPDEEYTMTKHSQCMKPSWTKKNCNRETINGQQKISWDKEGAMRVGVWGVGGWGQGMLQSDRQGDVNFDCCH